MRAGAGKLSAAVALLAYLVLQPAAAAVRYEREIQVERPGEVSVELDGAAILHLGPGGGVALLGPDGQPVPVVRRLASQELSCRGARVASIERVGDWFLIEIDPGSWAEPLGALRFELDERTMAPSCRLEVGGGGAPWREVARETLFRLGEGAALARTRIDFEPVPARRFRLFWPTVAGHPSVRAVEACAARTGDAPPRVPAAGISSVAVASSFSRFRLPTPSPAAPLEALEIELLPGHGDPVEYRVEFAVEGAWQPLAEGLWPQGASRHRIDLGDSAVPSALIHLELGGTGQELAGAEWILVPQRIRFEASQSGSYRLVYPVEARGVDTRRKPGGETVTARLGVEVPVEAATPHPPFGAPAPAARFDLRAVVEAPRRAEPGQPIALPLPQAIAGVALESRGDLRLIAAGRQLPFRVERAPEPATRTILSPATPRPDDRGGSVVEVDLGPAPELGWRGERLRLFAAAPETAFRRGVRVEETDPRPGRAVARTTAVWNCEARTGLPCSIRIGLPRGIGRRASVRFDDGDSAPLAGIAAELESPRDRLLFLWPAGDEPVELLVGADGVGPARFDLTALDAALLVADPLPALTQEPGSRLETAAEPWYERQPRALLVAALVLVAAALLAMLSRLVPRRPEGG